MKRNERYVDEVRRQRVDVDPRDEVVVPLFVVGRQQMDDTVDRRAAADLMRDIEHFAHPRRVIDEKQTLFVPLRQIELTAAVAEVRTGIFETSATLYEALLGKKAAKV